MHLDGLEVTNTKIQIWNPEEAIRMEILTLECIYTGMTDEASRNKEITQKEMGKESGQRKPVMGKKET